jgi:hypothetical protein
MRKIPEDSDPRLSSICADLYRRGVTLEIYSTFSHTEAENMHDQDMKSYTIIDIDTMIDTIKRRVVTIGCFNFIP